MIGNPLLLGPEGYQISRSVRLRSSASANFTRTPSVSGNMKTWTWSAWVKRGSLSQTGTIWGSNFASGGFGMAFGNYGGAGVSPQIIGVTLYAVGTVTTAAVFRDPSAWYHIVARFDSTQATQANRFRLYVNNVQQTLSGTLNVTLNADYHVNAASRLHTLGGESGYFNDCYLTEVNHIDGQSLDPSSFGETDVLTGVWKPKKYAGTYGTNGFFLNFSDNSSNTATTIGKDYSGNGNNWTPNNISVTAGSTYDSMLDVPTLWADGGNGRGNYATLNPVQNPPSGAVSTAYSNANLTTTLDSSVARSTIGVSSGKWYAEFVITSATLSTDTRFGVEPSDGNTFSGNAGQGRSYSANGNKVFNGSSTAYGSTWTTNDVIGCALDLDNGKVWWSKNGTWQASGDPAAGTGEAYSGLSGTYLFTIVNGNSAVSKTFNANFGQRPFAYTPPTGFKALNTQNLPEPTIKKGNAYFDATTYTGTNASLTITNSGAMQPDLVWVKARSQADQNVLCDAVRGVTKRLYSNLTNAEDATGGLVSINSSGFVLGDAATSQSMNNSGQTYIAWQWKEGATQGFDIVTFTGNGTARTIAHNLGVAPNMMIVKARSVGGEEWYVYHSGFASPATTRIQLNSTAAQTTGSTVWNSTNPTSSVFSIGNGNPNTNGVTYVAYLFSEVAGFSKFGSYTGNGSADGPFVFCGFRPRWVMTKRTDSSTSGNWMITDAARNTYNLAGEILIPNIPDQEYTQDGIDILSNGFKMRASTGNRNTSGGTFIYAAFAESPFKLSLAR